MPAIKGTISPDHIPVNKFQLNIPGFPPILLTAISGLETELDNVTLPDRTAQSGGRQKVTEFEITQPMHEELAVAAMENWFEDCQDPVSPLHKKYGATLSAFSQTDILQKTWLPDGMILTKRALPEFDLDNDGEMAVIVWTVMADEVHPLT